ncbi:bifunctional tetrahydrofolate synthase/dihydrofolate synthase [Oryzomicrobium sp.]|uniref:bifunctional tetrahydrofolate synthase/dihydrofolate synthase n=1 Tax=Oryzomicrobium sp. TaxID=1911578 RepID=UPI0025D07C44|nr:bifunctional tetrahydrofolate synthase/dihydrofolate synthase [Oryzomicrobium sp.]MCE1244252.1 bifunctional tetrahydrofolate synthase/dihydrofolate synthase [Oryzomicrobium sp.]
MAMSHRTLADWLTHLESLHPRGIAGIELGLERVARVKAALGQRETVPVITVAGTNGKGSVCAYLSTILDRAGYKVGCYTSPHLVAYNERVALNGVPADDATLCRAFARVEAARGDEALTYFEFGTLAAWEVFAEAGVDAVVLEVGLGGRLDAVNVYEPDVAVVTGIALDHQDFLGPDRESIGREKAGIYRAGKPALCADPQPPQSLLDAAAAIGADLRLLGRDFGFEKSAEDRLQWRYWCRSGGEVARRSLAYPGLRGATQLRNASVALAALEALKLRLPVAMGAIRRGLIETELAGRFQVLPGRPAVVLDVAHNPDAAKVLAGNLSTMGFFDRTYAVLGMLGDKDIAGTLAPLKDKVDYWLLADLAVPRGATAATLAEVIAAQGLGGTVETFAAPSDAFAAAAKRAGESDRIVTFGSFYTVADVLARVRPIRPAA